MNRAIVKILQFALIVVLPAVFLMGTIRALLATDTLLRVEYYRPGFSPDGRGFVPVEPLWGPAERFKYGTETLYWLRDGRPGPELAALKKGTGEPLYTASEVGHMVDVQRLTSLFSTLLLVLVPLAVLAIAYLAWRRETRPALAASLLGAGVLTWATVGLLALLLLGGVGSGSWDALFVGFHRLFFPQGNWQFLYSDSLIRLFPEQLWYDCAAVLVGGPLLMATVSGIAGWVGLKRKTG